MTAPLPITSEAKPRVTDSGPYKEDRFCTCCKKPLAGKVAWLELDQRTSTYHDFGGIPENESQGWFPFGMDCARNEIRKARGQS